MGHYRSRMKRNPSFTAWSPGRLASPPLIVQSLPLPTERVVKDLPTKEILNFVESEYLLIYRGAISSQPWGTMERQRFLPLIILLNSTIEWFLPVISIKLSVWLFLGRPLPLLPFIIPIMHRLSNPSFLST